MRIHPLWPAAAALAMLAACGLSATAYPTFGQASYRIEGSATTPEGQTIPTVIYRDGPKMRVETTLANNTHAIVVFDQATNAAYVLTPTAPPAPTPVAVSTLTNTTITPAGASTATTAQITPAPTQPQILGIATRVADADAPKPLEASWQALGKDNAQSSGACNVAHVNGHEWRPRQDTAGVERTACITDDGIVLRLREGNRVLFEASRLDRGPQAASMFGVPPGYQVIDPSAVAEQVGNTMQHLDSVTGEPAPTPSAPARPHG